MISGIQPGGSSQIQPQSQVSQLGGAGKSATSPGGSDSIGGAGAQGGGSLEKEIHSIVSMLTNLIKQMAQQSQGAGQGQGGGADGGGDAGGADGGGSSGGGGADGAGDAGGADGGGSSGGGGADGAGDAGGADGGGSSGGGNVQQGDANGADGADGGAQGDGANGGNGGNLQQASGQPGGAQQANGQPAGAQQANGQPGGAQQANGQPGGAQQSNVQPGGAQQTGGQQGAGQSGSSSNPSASSAGGPSPSTTQGGSSLAQNQKTVSDALDKAGATPAEKSKVLAMGELETTNMDASQRDKSKDGTSAQNYSAFNLNPTALKMAGLTPSNSLNDQKNIGQVAVGVLHGLRQYGNKYMDAVRGGSTAVQDGTSYGAKDYVNAIDKSSQQILANGNKADGKRVGVDLAHV